MDAYLELLCESEDVLVHTLMLGFLIASLQDGLPTAQLQIGNISSTEQTNPTVQSYLHSYVAKHVEDINQTTGDRLQTARNAYIGASEGIDEF